MSFQAAGKALLLSVLVIGPMSRPAQAAERTAVPTILRQTRFERSQELRLTGRVLIDHAIEVPAGVNVTLYTDGQVEFADGFTVRGGGVFSVLSAAQSPEVETVVATREPDQLLSARAVGSRLDFSLTRAATLDVSVVDVQGRSLLRIAPRSFSAGIHSLDLRQYGAPAGIYFYRIGAGSVSRQGRVLVIP
jgi:hypothetical protein